jgi:hypothetical protein
MTLVADASMLENPAAMKGLVAGAADPLRERWLQQIRRTGACRLRSGCRASSGAVDQVVYSTAREPDRALLTQQPHHTARAAGTLARARTPCVGPLHLRRRFRVAVLRAPRRAPPQEPEKEIAVESSQARRGQRALSATLPPRRWPRHPAQLRTELRHHS